MWDVAASSDLQNNRDHLLGPLLVCGFLHPLHDVSLSQSGEGLGAMWGQEKAKAMLAAAGFGGIEVHRIVEGPVTCKEWGMTAICFVFSMTLELLNVATMPDKTLQPPIRAQRSLQFDTVCSRGLRLNVEPLARPSRSANMSFAAVPSRPS
jgi:hypothetical protein